MDTTLNHLLIELYRAARESPVEEFQERAVVLMKTVCRVESALYATGRVHPTNGVTFYGIHLHNIPEDFISEHAVIADQDIVAWEVARRTGVCAINMRDLMPARDYPAVAEFDARFELQNALAQIVMDAPTDTLNGVFLWRSRMGDRFTEDERRLGMELLPHYIEASTQNRLIWLNELTASSIARRGVRAIANARGVLQTHDESFLELLRREWPEWRPPILPARLLAALQSLPARRFNGTHITVACDARRGMLLLLARAKFSMAGLTPSQLDVVRLIAKGYSNKDVGKKLGLSESTIRNHLYASFRILGVRKRAELVRRFSDISR